MAQKKSNGSTFMVGVVLIVAGLAALAYGYYLYDAARGSLGNALGKMFTGKSNDETQAIIIMICGGAAALYGAFLAFFRGRR